MTVPSYTTDLTTLALGRKDLDTGAWDESSDAAWDGAGAMVLDENLYYNGTECVSAQYTKSEVGTIMYDTEGPGIALSLPTDGAILMWHMWAAPPALSLKVDGGVRIIVGDSFGDFWAWIVSGRDISTPELIWNNHAIDPTIGSHDYLAGTAPTAFSVFGTAVNATAQSRGNPNAMNAIRYGRCIQIYEHGETGDYCMFSGFGDIDNASANKYALLREFGSGYLQQGLVSMGTATNPVDFRDANVNISIADTENVTSNFNRYEVVNASSNVEWNAISITALGTTSKGNFDVVDNATVEKTSCIFTDMDYFTYQSNSTLDTNTYRRCGLVTQGSGTFTKCTFDKASGTVALSADALNVVTKCVFNSDGTGHGVDIGTFVADTSVTWDNIDNDYTASSSGNEAIVCSVATGIILTINVADGASTPSVYNIGTGGAGSINVVSSKSKTFTGLPTNTEIRVRQGSYTLYHVQDVTTGSAVFSYTPDNSKPAIAQFTLPGYTFNPIDILLDGVNQSLPVTYKLDPSYI